MQDMAIFGGKRLETVPVKFSESEKAVLQKLAQSEDRGVGYIVRELAFRGLALYGQDGQLKRTENEENIIESSFDGNLILNGDLKAEVGKPEVRKVAAEKITKVTAKSKPDKKENAA